MVELDLDFPLMEFGAAYALTHPTRRPTAEPRVWIESLVVTLPVLARLW